MLNHILIPLDGSQLAESALEEAKRITAPGAQITLVTIIQSLNTPIYGYELTSALASSYETALEEAVGHARGYLSDMATVLRRQGYEVRTLAEFGDDPATIIAEKAHSLQVDAIVMSTHGRSGLSRLLLGSVAGKLLSLATCPVFIIPSRVPVFTQ